MPFILRITQGLSYYTTFQNIKFIKNSYLCQKNMTFDHDINLELEN